MSRKDGLHRLVDTLPESCVDEAERLLQALQPADPVLRSVLLAPLDDEPETPEEAAAVQEGRDAIARGEVSSFEEVCRELGL
jgi:hypothetical protein